jgi:adenylate cyclase
VSGPGPVEPPGPPLDPPTLEEILLEGPLRWSRDEAAARTGVPLAQARRLWRAMGFPDVGDRPRAFTDADLAALTRLTDLARDGVIDQELAVRITRAMGQQLSRLAEWQVDVMVDFLGLGGAPEEVRREVSRATAKRLLPDLERLLSYVWRRQLAAAVARVAGAVDQDASTTALSVGFCDMVGFTRLSRSLEESALVDMVERFETRCADIVASQGARLVKTLGDEVFFAAPTVQVAAEIALRMTETAGADPQLPEVRVGVASGPVLSRMGDLFGHTVNRASRLTSEAPPGTVLVDHDTAEGLASSRAYAAASLRTRALRGLGLVQPAVLRRRD